MDSGCTWRERTFIKLVEQQRFLEHENEFDPEVGLHFRRNTARVHVLICATGDAPSQPDQSGQLRPDRRMGHFAPHISTLHFVLIT